jgi:HD-GYP domain-containing protein (c-di-GMP phosphodiesterase class II)
VRAWYADFTKDLRMSTVVIEVPPEHLTTGLYVCGLDRPWEETPFLFQGFVIESDDELQMLRRLCKVVYVEVSVEDAEDLKSAARRAPAVSTQASDAPDALLQLSNSLTARVDQVPIKDPTSLEAELTKAKNIFDEAKRAVGNVFEHLRRGGGLDVPDLQSVVGSMVDSVFRNRDAMGWLASMKNKDDYLYNHSLAASVWALAFGRHLGLDKETLKVVGTGAMLLDIGKTRLTTELLKRPGKPSAEEWQMIRAHVDHGIKLLEAAPNVDKRIMTMIATHHERLDGSGYPHNLKGEEIPLIGRIAAIVDCYDAMISERTYAKAKSTFDAVRELKRLGGVAFPTELVELFIQAVGVFPTGTLVELNTGEVGVVIGQNRYRRLRPQVMLILDAQKKVRAEFTTIDLLTCEENIGNSEPTMWIADGLERGAYGIDPSEYFV